MMEIWIRGKKEKEKKKSIRKQSNLRKKLSTGMKQEYVNLGIGRKGGR